MKKIKYIISTLVLATSIFLVLSFISFFKFQVINPFSLINGFIKIYSGYEYHEVQKNPKVILLNTKNSNNSFELFLNDNGFVNLEDKRMGSILTLEKNNKKYVVVIGYNSYYGKVNFLD